MTEELNIFLQKPEWEKITFLLKEKAFETNDVKLMELAVKIQAQVKYKDAFIYTKSVIKKPSKINSMAPDPEPEPEPVKEEKPEVKDEFEQVMDNAKTMIMKELAKEKMEKIRYPKTVLATNKVAENTKNQQHSPFKKETHIIPDNNFIQNAC